MKNIITIYFLFGVLQLTIAQPAIVSSDIQVNGSAISTSSVFEGMPSGYSVGPDQIWDFSGVIPIITYDPVSVEYVSDSPYSSDFPDANIISKTMDDNYYFAKITTDDLFDLGFESSTFSNKPIDPKKMLTFPFEYGNLLVDTFQFEDDFEPRLFQREYVGWGKLTTPTGIYENVIQFQDVLFSLDPMYVLYSQNTFVSIDPVYSVIFAYSVDGATGYYFDNEIISTINQSSVNLNPAIIISPNPSEDEVKLTFHLEDRTEASIEIYDISGKLVNSYIKEEILQGNQTIIINIQELESGYYTVKFIFNGFPVIHPIIKI